LETVIVNAEEKDDQFSEDGKLLKKFTDSFSNYPFQQMAVGHECKDAKYLHLSRVTCWRGDWRRVRTLSALCPGIPGSCPGTR